MPIPSDDFREQHAAAVPVYVRDSGTSWDLHASDGGLLSEHATAREALDAALADQAAGFVKRANLREEGEPIGAWRWLDASAEEDEPIGGARITAPSIWEMCASLNTRKSAIPINGGGAPRAGLGDSLPHGDAYTGGDHLANGYAHVALPVIDEDERVHIFLRSELLPEIDREVELGRLAYGSIRFAFESVDETNNFGIKGATLISHALTNDPAVTTLTAGSERRRTNGGPAFIACRTWRAEMPKQTHKRGPAGDKLRELLSMLGIEWSAEMEGEGWYSPASEAVAALKSAAKVETIVEGAPAEGGEAAMQRAGVREVEGVEPDKVEATLTAMLAFGRKVLGKPDASADDVLAELESRAEEIGKAIGTDTPPAEEPSEAAAEEGGRPVDVKPEDEKPKDEPKPEPEKDKGEAEKERAALRAKVDRLEMREWLRKEIAARHLDREHGDRKPIPEPEIEELVDHALGGEKGRALVTKLLDARNAPPSAHPLDTTAAPGPDPKTLREATDLCMKEITEQHPSEQRHVQRARAQKLARERFPHLAA